MNLSRWIRALLERIAPNITDSRQSTIDDLEARSRRAMRTLDAEMELIRRRRRQ